MKKNIGRILYFAAGAMFLAAAAMGQGAGFFALGFCFLVLGITARSEGSGGRQSGGRL